MKTLTSSERNVLVALKKEAVLMDTEEGARVLHKELERLLALGKLGLAELKTIAVTVEDVSAQLRIWVITAKGLRLCDEMKRSLMEVLPVEGDVSSTPGERFWPNDNADDP